MSLAQKCGDDCSCSYIGKIEELSWPFSFRTTIGTTKQNLSIYEDEETFTVKAQVPGLAADDIEITVEKNTLVISGRAKPEENTKQANYLCRMKDSFDYCLTIPCELSDDALPTAECTNGIATIVFQKKKKSGAIKIPIK